VSRSPWFLPWRRHRGAPPAGDPEGVRRANAELDKSTTRLARDQRDVIMPLRREAYRNNIQALVIAQLTARTRGDKGKREPGSSPR
jgi:hypothetical protein